MPVLRRHCPAKLNLTLAVRPPRTDGFHPIESLIALVDFGDELAAQRRDDPTFALTCDHPDVPRDRSNLVIRAAESLRAAAGRELPGLAFGLTKRIPPGSGLGGGSSNAAAALRLAHELWNLDLPRDELMAIAAGVGSDVPLFLANAPAVIVTGRGERVTPVAEPPAAWAAILLSGIHCATAAVYNAFDAAPPPPVRPAAAAALEAAHGAPGSDTWLFNDLQPAAFAVQPALAELAARIQAGTGARVHMSGSGSALFRLCATEHEARAFSARAGRAVPGIGVAVTPLATRG